MVIQNIISKSKIISAIAVIVNINFVWVSVKMSWYRIFT